MLALLVAFYLIRGMVRLESGRSGRVLVRFTAFERLVHWMTATCFIILAISGLNITFGKPLLLPLMGPETFTTWSQWAKYAHNYLSFPFTLGVVLIFLMWIAWNLPTKVDVNWLKRRRRHGRPQASPRRPLQCRPEDDLLDRGAGRRRCRRQRLFSHVPVLRHQHRQHAIGPDRAWRRRAAVRRGHDRSHLHRHDRDGRRLRRHVGRHGRRKLGEGAPFDMGGKGGAPAVKSRPKRREARSNPRSNQRHSTQPTPIGKRLL